MCVCVCMCTVLYFDHHFQVNRKVIELRIAKKTDFLWAFSLKTDPRHRIGTNITYIHREWKKNIKGPKNLWCLFTWLFKLKYCWCTHAIHFMNFLGFCFTFSVLINAWTKMWASAWSGYFHTVFDDMKNCWRSYIDEGDERRIKKTTRNYDLCVMRELWENAIEKLVRGSKRLVFNENSNQIVHCSNLQFNQQPILFN